MRKAGLFAIVVVFGALFARAGLSQDWETLVTDAAAPQTVSLGTTCAPWKLEVVFSGLKAYDEISLSNKYPQLVGVTDGADAVYLAVNGWENSRDLFLTGAKTGTQAGTPVGNVNGNNDVGNGELWAPTNGVITILVENDGRHLSVSQNGHLFIKTDKNTSGGTLTSVTLGSGLSQLGGGKIASARVLRECFATVVRAHPRLTSGLERESLIGVKFAGRRAGAIGDVAFRFDLTNCTPDRVSDVRLWRQKYDPVPFAFFERDAIDLTANGMTAQRTAGSDGSLTVAFSPKPGTALVVYPQAEGRGESDYLWVTAKIADGIATNAEIWASFAGETIALGDNVFTVTNGVAKAPHRPFPYRYQIGAYVRQDRLVDNGSTTGDIFSGNPKERFETLTDVLPIYSAKDGYSNGKFYIGNWDSGLNDTASTRRLIGLRDKYHPACMIRPSLTPSSWVTANGIYGLAFEVAGAAEASRRQFAEAIVAFLQAQRCDGLDIDYEWVRDGTNHREWQNIGKMLRELSEQFFDHGYVLSFAGRSHDSAQSGMPYTEADYGAFHVPDYMMVQSYGGGWLNAAPCIQRRSLAVCTKRGLPARRVVMGQAAYVSADGHPGWDGAASKVAAFTSDPFRRYDIDTWWKTPYSAYWPFEGMSSLQAQCLWARRENLGGVMSWGYYTDPTWTGWSSFGRHQAKAMWPMARAWREPEKVKGKGQEWIHLLKGEEDWFWLADHPDVKARLANDIVLEHDPVVIDTWTGELDGDGHKLTFAKDTWVVSEKATGLIRTLQGTVKNLTVEMDGRVFTVAARWNDQTANPADVRLTNTMTGENPVGVIAAEAVGGAVVENVTVVMGAGSEVKGVKYVGGLVGKVSGAATVRNSRVEVGGKLHVEVRNVWDTLFQPAAPAIGAVVGKVAGDGATLDGNTFVVCAGGEVEDLDAIPPAKYALPGEWREPTGWDMALPREVDVRSGDWAIEVKLDLPGYSEGTLQGGQYPQLVSLVGDGTSVSLSASGDGGGELFLTGNGTATYSYPVSRTAMRGNGDVGSGVKLAKGADGFFTLTVENAGGELRIGQNGATALVTDKNNANAGYLVKALVGKGLSQLGGGRIVSVRVKTGRRGEIVHPTGYGKLVFDEEFGGDTLDTNRWEKVPDNARHVNWKQYTSHREDLVAVSNGCLVLTGVLNDKSDGDQRRFLCGQVQSSGKFSFKYGMVEIRAKFEDQDGAWPAMWMMPQSAVHGGWPYSGEIDITERLNADAKVYQTAHFGYGDKDSTAGTTAAIVNGQFNVYRLEWTESKITWYVNGVATHSYSNDGSGYLKWPFDSPFYFILSQQLEGSWVGTVDDTSTLPVRMYVDYVRVWQKDEEDVRQNAYLWLDAADASTVETNAAGEVTAWHSANICGKTAGQYALASDSPSGPTMIDCQLPSANCQLVSFGGAAANRDLKFERTTGLRTVFMVAKAEQGGNAFLLGDGTNYDFHRGANGEYWHATYASEAIRNGKTLWNGELVADATAATMPAEFGLVEVHAADGVAASQLCYDRAGNGATARRGGKDIAELIAFEDALTERQSAEIRRYLMSKWGVGSAATWTMTAEGIDKQGSAEPTLIWVMNYDVAEGATIGDGGDLANLNAINLAYAEKPVTLAFTNQVASILAGAETVLAKSNAATLVVGDGMKATLREGVTAGGYQLEAGGTLRIESDLSGGTGLGGAFVAGSAGTYEFRNVKLTGGLQSGYKVRVTDGDSVVIGGDTLGGRCRFAFDVRGGRVTFPAVASTWVENASYRQSGGEFVSLATSKAQSGTGDGFMLGFGSAAMTLDVSGGLFAVPDSSVNFYNPVTLDVGGTGVVRAKGMFRSSKEATVNVNAGGTLEIGSLGLKAATCVLNLKGGTLKGYEPGAAVHDNVNLHAPSVLASAPGASLAIDGTIYYGSTVTLAAGSTLTLPSDGALTFGLKTDCAGVRVTDGVLDFGTARGAELTALSGTGTIRISLTGEERRTAKDGIRLFKWSGGGYAGNVTVVPDAGGPAALVAKDGYLTFTPAITALGCTIVGATNWCDIVWTDDFGNRAVGNAVTNYAAAITAGDGAVVRVGPADDVNAISLAVSGRLTVFGEGLPYLPWSGTDVGGTVVYAGTYDLGEGVAGFSASGTYEFATNCTVTANKFMTGNTYDVVQTFNQLGGRVTVTNAQDGTATGSAPVIFAHWGSGRPSTVTYNLLGGEFVATNAARYALYFGADGKPTLNVGGGDGAALMDLSGLAQGTDGTARTQPGAVNVGPNGTLRIGAGGIYLRNANTAFNLAGGTLAFAEGCSVAVAHAGRVNLTADSTVSVPTGKTVTFAHPWTGSGKLSLVGGGHVSLALGISSKNVHDGIAVEVAKVADGFPTDCCRVYFTCDEYEGVREAAKLEVADGVLMATPQVDETVWVQTDITGNNANLQFTCLQTQSSFYRGKGDYQPLIGLRADKLQHTALWRVYAQLSDATDPAMVADVKLYKTTTPYFAAATEVTSAKVAVTKPSATSRGIAFDFWNGGAGSGALPSVAVGSYLWVCVRLNASAPAHAELDAKVTGVHVNGQVAYVYNADPKGAGEVYPYAFHIVPYWRLNGWTLNALTRQHFACYTEIIPFYVTVGANGSVGHGWNGEQFTDEKFRAAIDRIKTLRAGKDVKLLVGVGFSQGNLPTVCANETLRRTAAQNLAAFVGKFGLDGVDFDWEYPTAKAHWEGWCNLVADLKPLLFRQGGGKLVSVAVTGWRTQQGGGDLGAGAAVKGLYQQCDFVNMMSYDGGEAAGHSTLALMNNDFTRAANYGGIPNYKICGGQAFYTNRYPCDGSQNGYGWVVNNYPQYVDSTDKFTGSDGKIYTYNSIATIKAKTARCKELGGGAMIWANETDTALSHPKSATRAMFSQLWPTRPANDGTLTVEQAADWPAVVSAGAVTLANDITLDAGILRPAVFSGTLDGGGHVVTVTDDAPAITTSAGKLKNVTVKYANGVNMVYDADGNAFRGCDYPNAGEAPVLAAPHGVGFTASQLVTVGAMVNIPEGHNGDVVNLVDGSYRIWLRAVPNGTGFVTLKLGWTDTDGKTLKYRDGGTLVTTGPHAVSVTCSATKGQGTRVYVDGELTATDGTLNFSSASFSKVYFGSAGMGLYACDAVGGCRGAFVYPFSASYPAFNVIGIHADDDPLELTDLAAYASNVTATVFASVKSPDGVFGPVVDFTVRQGGNTFVVEANRADATTSKLAWRYLGSDSRTYAEQKVTARETAGNRVWHMSYDAAGGTYLDVNGKSAASSAATKWSKSMVNGMAVGLRAGMEVGERKWLPGQAAAASASDPLGGLVETPDWYGEVSAAAQDYLFEKLGDGIAAYEVPEITVNGKVADTNAALLAMRFFGGNPSEARDYSLSLGAPVVTSDKVTLGLYGDQPVNAALQLRMRETLADAWRIAAELPARSAARSFSFPLDVGGKFYQLRASEAVTAKAPQGMPIDSRSAVSQANLGTLTLDGERFFEVTLGGAGVAEGTLGYLAVGGVAYVGRVGADGKMTFDFGADAPAAGTAAALTLVIPKGATNGNVRVVSPSVGGIAYPDALVTEVVADTLYGDGFTTKSFGQYRIPSLVTDGAGEVLCLYDVRYGGGDLGTGDGIDIGETYSADGGRTFARPRLAIDVPNKRERDQSQRTGWSNDWDIGDVSTLYDPVTSRYWLMGITGQGLNPGDHTKNDVVMYTRGKGEGALRWEGRVSVKDMIAAQPGVPNSAGTLKYGFLAGPGHGFVTTADVAYSNGNVACTMPKGTLVFPMQYFVDGSFTTSSVGALYSTDHGTNWTATARSATTDGPQENCVMELDDGSWYMTAKAGYRNSNYAETGKFKFFRSKDYRTWSAVGVYSPVPCQQGSCLRLGRATDGRGRYVLCHTLDRQAGVRAKLALVFGTDTTAEAGDAAGIAWDFANPLMLYYDNTGFKGYNSLCMVDAKTLGVLYEAQGRIYFVRVDISGRLK